MDPVSGSGFAEEREWNKFCREWSGWKRSELSTQTPSTVKPTQTRRKELQIKRYPDFELQSCTVDYESRRYLGSLSFSEAFKKAAGYHRLWEATTLSPASSPWFLLSAPLSDQKRTTLVLLGRRSHILEETRLASRTVPIR